MKWMIRVDMEGLTGVVDMNQVVPGASEYAYGQKMLMHDLAAVVDGLLQREEDEVWLYDIHFYGRNVDLAALGSKVTAICGKPNYTPANGAYMRGGGFDGMILLGLHAKAGTDGALLNHNYEHDIQKIHVNGLSVGEIGLEALMAGEAGVPLVLVTADSEGCRETESLLPGTLTVPVKQSLGESAAACAPPSVTGPLLREAASACAAAASKLKPFVIEGPIALEMTFRPGTVLERVKAGLGSYLVAPDRVVITGATVIEAWEKYLIAKSAEHASV